ncbi:MAG: FHA domain-containing protein [Acidobacteria bacterium]|nr:FHA domain-containing protein [Acidobacteriota bacterium]
MWLLKTSEGAEAALTFRLLPGNVKTVGRAPRADFIVDAALVSRLHCRLAAGAEEIELVDLGSTNGTFVNGQRVDGRASVKPGDTIGIGRVDLLVSEGMDSTGAPDRSS